MSFTDLLDSMNAAQIAAFGQSVSYFRPGDAPSTVSVIVTDTIGDATQEAPVHAVVFGVADDFPQAPVAGDRFIINSENYVVWEPVFDRGGGVFCKLRKIA